MPVHNGGNTISFHQFGLQKAEDFMLKAYKTSVKKQKDDI